jgi:hypothetical protein
MTASLARLTELARLCLCGQCWQQPGQPCETSPPGDHLARYLRAARRGLIGHEELSSLLVTDPGATPGRP